MTNVISKTYLKLSFSNVYVGLWRGNEHGSCDLSASNAIAK